MARLFVAALVAALSSALGCGWDPLCGNVELARHPSPDRKREVLVFQRNCGATTGYVTHVSLVDSGDALDDNDDGNLYIEDEDLGGIEVRCHGPRAVVIRAQGPAFRAETEFDGISIRYE